MLQPQTVRTGETDRIGSEICEPPSFPLDSQSGEQTACFNLEIWAPLPCIEFVFSSLVYYQRKLGFGKRVPAYKDFSCI